MSNMEQLKAKLEVVTAEELERANKKFPLFNSAHEGQNVIREEVEEAAEDLRDIEKKLQLLWNAVKANKNDITFKRLVAHIKRTAIELSCEAVQIAAMSQKFIDSQGGNDIE